mmetsp:Transcript_24820/g.86425  ORF Transcript_24820/g.86425 Transcript_24820/m.86425 type:complete len:527 (+) Transcript_24820:2495-4075(+)
MQRPHYHSKQDGDHAHNDEEDDVHIRAELEQVQQVQVPQRRELELESVVVVERVALLDGRHAPPQHRQLLLGVGDGAQLEHVDAGAHQALLRSGDLEEVDRQRDVARDERLLTRLAHRHGHQLVSAEHRGQRVRAAPPRLAVIGALEVRVRNWVLREGEQLGARVRLEPPRRGGRRVHVLLIVAVDVDAWRLCQRVQRVDLEFGVEAAVSQRLQLALPRVLVDLARRGRRLLDAVGVLLEQLVDHDVAVVTLAVAEERQVREGDVGHRLAIGHRPPRRVLLNGQQLVAENVHLRALRLRFVGHVGAAAFSATVASVGAVRHLLQAAPRVGEAARPRRLRVLGFVVVAAEVLALERADAQQLVLLRDALRQIRVALGGERLVVARVRLELVRRVSHLDVRRPRDEHVRLEHGHLGRALAALERLRQVQRQHHLHKVDLLDDGQEREALRGVARIDVGAAWTRHHEESVVLERLEVSIVQAVEQLHDDDQVDVADGGDGELNHGVLVVRVREDLVVLLEPLRHRLALA